MIRFSICLDDKWHDKSKPNSSAIIILGSGKRDLAIRIKHNMLVDKSEQKNAFLERSQKSVWTID